MNIKENDAVSPVVGVMLMIVVTVIIAAVVSAFAGGLADTEEKPPTASFKCSISNDGTWGGSAFDMKCLATSEAVPTKDLKLITAWTTTDKTDSEGRILNGGATITGPPTEGNENTQYDSDGGDPEDVYHSPIGYGPGIDNWVQFGGYEAKQYFGNYSIVGGTTMHNSAYGYNADYGGYGVSSSTRFKYSDGSGFVADDDTDAMRALLGDDWNNLRPGDIVSVKLVHIPSNKVIFDEKVVVEG